MRRNLLSGDWPAHVGRHLLTSVDSTNAYGLRLPDVPAWVLAEEQTAGRGRRGRSWVSPRGNFYGSLILAPDDPPERRALRSFVAALALRDALAGLLDVPTALALKWPNDVLLNGGKVSGILLEGQSGRLAIGIGVNLIGAPPAEAVEGRAIRPTSVFGETGVRLTPPQLLDALAPAFAAREAQLAQDFRSIRDDFLRHAVRIGEPIIARTVLAEHQGIFRTVDDTGALILETADGPLAIPAADIFFGGRDASGH